MKVRIEKTGYREYNSLREAINAGVLKSRTEVTDADYFISAENGKKLGWTDEIDWKRDIAVFLLSL